MNGEQYTANSKQSRADALKWIEQKMAEHPYLVIHYTTEKQRSGLQNNALHLWCTQVAEALNAAGITFTQFFKPGFEVPWNDKIIKEQVWKPVQGAMTGEGSTSKASTTDYPKVYEQLNLKLSGYGIHVPWPVRKEKNDG